MSGGGGSPSGNTTTTQNSAPWSGQQQFLLGTGPTGTGGAGGGAGSLSQYFGDGYTIPGTNISLSSDQLSGGLPGALPSAAALYENYAPSYYPGQQVAPFTPSETGAISSLENYATTPNSTINAAGSFNSNLLNGDYLNSNPAQALQYNLATGNFANTPGLSDLESMANGNYFDPRGDFAKNLTQSIAQAVQPGVDSRFVDNPDNSNRMYSVASAVDSQLAPMEANMQNSAASTLAGIESGAATQYGTNYNNAAQQELQGLFYAPQTAQMPVTQAETGFTAGQTAQSQQQSDINAAMNQYNWQQMLPYQLLGNYNGEVGGNYGGTTTTTEPYYAPSGGLFGLSGGAGGLLGMAAGAGAAYLSGGSLIPAMMAGGMGGSYLSDRRAKEDIVQIGEADNELPIYLFRYKGDPRFQIGFMAQDVEKVHPEAVTTHPSGLKLVDYAQAAA